MDTVNKTDNKDYCATCRNLNFINHEEQYCKITNLPISLKNSCELHESIPIEEHTKKNNIPKGKIFLAILAIIVFIAKFNAIISLISPKHTPRDFYKDLGFDIELTSSKDTTMSHTRYLVYNYKTSDRYTTKAFLDKNLKTHYVELKNSFNKKDTVIFINALFLYSVNAKDITQNLMFMSKGISFENEYDKRIFRFLQDPDTQHKGTKPKKEQLKKFTKES